MYIYIYIYIYMGIRYGGTFFRIPPKISGERFFLSPFDNRVSFPFSVL